MKSPDKSFLSILALVLCALSAPAFAQQRTFPAYVGHVNDFANAIDPATEQRLETILTNFEKLTGAQIAAVVIPSLNERPIEEYAIGLYRAWGIGAKSGDNKNKGALLIVALADRKTRLEVGYGLEGDLPDGLAGELIRRMRPSLQQGQTGQAVEIGVRSLVDTLAEKWNVNIDGIDRRFAYRAPARAAPMSGKSMAMIAGLFILFFILMAFAARSARKRAARGGRGAGSGSDLWWMAPIIFNNGGGGFGGGTWNSSGGWGDSGGGGGGSDWGGFGGGGSGGGGASDSW